MLVLTRKRGESIWIGSSLVTIIGHGRGGVRLGIEAPRDVSIVRTELLTPITHDEVRQALADGVPFHVLEARRDWEENQG